MPEKPTKKKRQLNTYVKYSSLATQIAVIIIAGAFFGKFIDSNTTLNIPIFTIFFSLFAIVGSLFYVFNKIKNDN